MNETNPSKRLVIIIVSITALLSLLGITDYVYQRQKAAKAHKAAQSAKKPAIKALLAKTPTAAEVLTLLFGVKTRANKVNSAANELSSLWFAQSFTQGNKNFHAVFIKTQKIDPDSKEVFGSHADAPSINIVVYQWVNNQWQLFSKQINVGDFGSWGDVPDIKQAATMQLSADNLTFLIDGGWTGQGYTEAGQGLFSFNFKEKIWKNLGFIQTGGDNAGTCDDKPQPGDSILTACWSFTGEITLAKTGKNPNYPDLLVKHKGTTSDDNNKIIPAHNRLYVFNGEQYVEPGAEAR